MNKLELERLIKRLRLLEEKATEKPWTYGNRTGDTIENPSEWGQEGLWSGTYMFFGSGPGYDSNTVIPDEIDLELITLTRNNLSEILDVAEKYLGLLD